MLFVIVDEVDERLELRRSDEKQASLLLHKAVLDLLLCDERDGKGIWHTLANPDQKCAVRVDPRQNLFGLLPAPVPVKPWLNKKRW